MRRCRARHRSTPTGPRSRRSCRTRWRRQAAEQLGAGLEAAATVLNETCALPPELAPPGPRPSRSTSAPSRSARRRSAPSTPTSPPGSTTSPCSTRTPAATPRPSRSTSAPSRSARRPRPRAPQPRHPAQQPGRLYQATGRYAEAEPLYQRAIAIGEKTLGPEHPDLATRLNNLARLYRATGRYAEAEPLYQRAIAIFEASHRPGHPNIATVRANYARTSDPARPLQRRASPTRLRPTQRSIRADARCLPSAPTVPDDPAVTHRSTSAYPNLGLSLPPSARSLTLGASGSARHLLQAPADCMRSVSERLTRPDQRWIIIPIHATLRPPAPQPEFAMPAASPVPGSPAPKPPKARRARG